MELLRRPWSSSQRAWFVLSLSFSALWWAVDSLTNQYDVTALNALTESWGQKASSSLQWIGNDPCGSGWTGLQCDTSSPQRVTSLVLDGLGLVGNLPTDIGLLSALQTLDLSSNNLTGSIPTQIGQLTHLSELQIMNNFLSGSIPTQIGMLQNLTILSLNGNNLTGGIPNEIGLLSKLFWLDLAQNQLDGPLPFSSDGNSNVQAGLDNLTMAQHFHLNNNSFSGSIPDAICHSGMILIHLLLDSNLLTGTIPGSLGLCSKLLVVKLNNNLLRGEIPDQIAQLTSLTQLQLGGNQLVGPLPDLSNLTSLGVIDLSGNMLNIEFPVWMSSLSMLTDLLMQDSQVGGSIPPSFFKVETLNNLKMANNRINGTLDLSFATSQLTLVSMENNSIESVTAGNFNLDLRLQGNPVCTKPTNLYSPKVCSDSSPVSAPATYGMNSSSCSITCGSGLQLDFLQCTCAVPFEGILTYRIPSFTSMDNASRIPTLVSAIEKKLSINQNQVQISDANFNGLNQLIVYLAIFPSGSTEKWSLKDVSRMTSRLSDVSPDGWGPASFKALPYDYTVLGSGKSGLSMAAKIGIVVGVVLMGLAILAVGCFACMQKRRADKAVELSKPFGPWGRASGKDSGSAPQLKGARFFSFAELKKATNNFSESNEIGSGGYGKVYRGIISSGEQVAVKRAQGNSMQGATEFKTEIELLSRMHHKNVVGLVGFCFEQGEQMLVYEYMAGGSLRDCLVGRSGVKLDWRRRIMIALGAARGITYLHELVNPPVIHRDIKSTNILLDERKIAKVADFGLSKVGPGDGSGKQHVSTQVKGTLGYLDPEYYISQQLTEKSDVYSYGVVLLELLTSRAPIEHGKYVVKEAKTAIDKGGLSGLRTMLDPRLRDEDLPELNMFVRIALSCVEDSAASRPSMSEVVRQLEELIGHDYPESGSSNIDVQKGQAARYPYGSDSDYLHTSKESSDVSFPNSTNNIPASFGSR